MLGKDIVLAIAGNKIDLEKARSVSIEEAETYAKDVGAEHYSTSAKLNKGINELFMKLTERMLNAGNEDKQVEEVVSIGRRPGKGPIVITEQNANQEASSSSSSGGCCGS